MPKTYLLIVRWFAAVLAVCALFGIFYNVVMDNMAKGEVRKIEGYTPWSKETIRLVETLPVQNGGRITPFSTRAGFFMLSLHGARSMKIEDGNGKQISISPTAWMMDSIFRPMLAVKLPTFRIDNSEVLESAGIKVRNRRDRYSYDDIESGREKLIELAKGYEATPEKERPAVQQQTIDLAYNIRNYESLLGYFSFARSGVTLVGTGTDTKADQRADISSVMMTSPQIHDEIAKSQREGTELNPRIKNLLEQVLDAANFSKFGLFILPSTDAADPTWQTAGNAIMGVMTQEAKDPKTAIEDIKMMEVVARSISSDDFEFRKELTKLHDRLVKRAQDRGQYDRIELEASYYRANWFLNSLVFFILGMLLAFAMWTAGSGLTGRILTWLTFASTAAGWLMVMIAIWQRCLIMHRPPVGNLYETIIFITAAVVLISFLIEWMTKLRFALGIAPILGTVLIIIARRYELGDAKDNMDPLVAVLNSNFWLMTHVTCITLGYSAGLLSAFLAFGYVVLRGLHLDGGNKNFRRSLTRIVYGMICLTLFLSLVGTVLGGIWANDSWGRFWGWDPKENGALMIVLWSLAILHARLGGYIKEWGLHLAGLFTSCVVVFSWWHVNFLGVGLHNYGFTAEKKWMVWVFYSFILFWMIFGWVSMALEKWAETQNAEERERLAAAKV